MENKMETYIYIYWGYIEDYIGDYYRGYKGGY